GVVAGKSDHYQLEIKRGTAFAPFHTVLEVGVILTQNLELGVQLRAQFAPSSTYGVEPHIRWLPLVGSVEPYAQFGMIFSKLRYNIDLSPRPLNPPEDTITPGFVGISAGGGVALLMARG